MQANKGGQKVAMVTGSTKGIGRAIAERLVADGYSVITNGRNEPAAVLGESRTLVLAVKPAKWREALGPLTGTLNPETLIVSVMAGVAAADICAVADRPVARVLEE